MAEEACFDIGDDEGRDTYESGEKNPRPVAGKGGRAD
jgi:hypothetical protein